MRDTLRRWWWWLTSYECWCGRERLRGSTVQRAGVLHGYHRCFLCDTYGEPV
jgi:hypothetical protein